MSSVNNSNKTEDEEKQNNNISGASPTKRALAVFGKLVLLAIGAVILNLFTATLARGISNIGNLTGVAFAIIFMVTILFWKYVKRLIIAGWKKRPVKILFVIATVGVVTIIIFIAIFSVCIYRGTTDEEMFSKLPKTSDDSFSEDNREPVLIVLGCQVRGYSPSLMLTERLDAAYEYMIEHPEAVCIVSGGKGPGEKISEAKCMYDYLINKGISGDRIYKEDKSTTTAENLLFSREILEREGLGNDIAIVTNEFHEYRARRQAYTYGLSSIPVSAETAGWLFPTFYVRELYAIPGYFLKY